jgi:D-alanine-D-alanine ligase
MNVAFTYNVRHTKPDANNQRYLKEAEFDEPETIDGITKALESLGHRVMKIEADEFVCEKLRAERNNIDMVFNIAEGMNGADREAQLPAIMEMLQIPYTGPKPLGYAVGLNKSVAKEILSYYKIATPHWMTVNKVDYLDDHEFKHFPAIAKPMGEGSSKGIRVKNLVKNQEELKEIVKGLLMEFNQPVLIEEYLPGREFTVAVIGHPTRVLPIIELTFPDLPPDLPRFDHFEAKWIYEDAGGPDPFDCPAKLDKELKEKIENLCLQAFNALEMEDWARFDIRLDKEGEPNFIEVNCPPGIIPDPRQNSRFPRAARAAGLSYEQMIGEILKSACSRYGIECR